jgi:hypothetical protein
MKYTVSYVGITSDDQSTGTRFQVSTSTVEADSFSSSGRNVTFYVDEGKAVAFFTDVILVIPQDKAP